MPMSEENSQNEVPVPWASLFQVVLQDATETGSGKEPSSTPEGPEKGPGHREASEEGLPELRTLEQRHPAYPG